MSTGLVQRGMNERASRNRSLTEHATASLNEELARMLVPGYYGSLEVNVQVQDGVIQIVKVKPEKHKK